MTDGFMSDITALQALVPVLCERADAGAADFAGIADALQASIDAYAAQDAAAAAQLSGMGQTP